MFTTARVSTTKMCKQPKCPQTDERIKKLWYICDRIPFGHQKHKLMPFVAAWIQQEGMMLSEVSQKEKETVDPLLCRLRSNQTKHQEKDKTCKLTVDLRCTSDIVPKLTMMPEKKY